MDTGRLGGTEYRCGMGRKREITSARRLATTAARSAPRPSVAGAMAVRNMSPRRAATCPSTTAHLYPMSKFVNTCRRWETFVQKSLNQVGILLEYGVGRPPLGRIGADVKGNRFLTHFPSPPFLLVSLALVLNSLHCSYQLDFRLLRLLPSNKFYCTGGRASRRPFPPSQLSMQATSWLESVCVRARKQVHVSVASHRAPD